MGFLKDEYDPSEGEDKIKLLEDFQNNKLLNVKVNITEWLVSLATQVMKLNKLNHPINDDYLMTHILASLPHEYSSVVDHAKIEHTVMKRKRMERRQDGTISKPQ